MLNADDERKRERQRWRREHVDRFLAEIGLDHDALAKSTKEQLDDWAREVKLVEDQPSSNFGDVVLHLCKAVESELASGLGRIEGLKSLAAEGTLGQKARTLNGFRFEKATNQRISSRGIKPGFVQSDLARLLRKLADLRSDTGAAHGNVELQSANEQDAERARQLTGGILRGIVPVSREKSK